MTYPKPVLWIVGLWLRTTVLARVLLGLVAIYFATVAVLTWLNRWGPWGTSVIVALCVFFTMELVGWGAHIKTVTRDRS